MKATRETPSYLTDASRATCVMTKLNALTSCGSEYILNESARLVEVALGCVSRCRITRHSTGLAISLIVILNVDGSPVNSALGVLQEGNIE